MMMIGGLDSACVVDDYQEGQCYSDGISGKALDQEGVREARREEMGEFRTHGVYEEVPLTACWNQTGMKPVGVIWVDANKGDEGNPEYRSILVAEEINTYKDDDLFAAPPPLEAKKMLMSMAVTEGIGYERGRPRE